MLYSCYNYHCNRFDDTLIFITDTEKGVINIYYDVNIYDYIVITENKMRDYPALYKKYIVSFMLTEYPYKVEMLPRDNFFDNLDLDCYFISKKTIWKNLYITQNYNGDDTLSFGQYPEMSYALSTDTSIDDYLSQDTEIEMIDNDLIIELLDDEAKNIEKELYDIEEYFNNFNYNCLCLKYIVPTDFPDDLINNIIMCAITV